MPGDPAAAMKQPAIDHRAAADTGADSQIDDVPDTLAGAVAPFAKGGGNGVILHHRRNAGALGQCLRDRKPVPSRKSGNPRHGAGFGVNRPGKRQADAAHRAARRAGTQLVDQPVYLIHHTGWPALDIGRQRRPVLQCAAGKQRHAKLRAADIDGDDAVVRHDPRPDPAGHGPRPCGRPDHRPRRQAIP